jgi:hypothetical protein
VGVLTSHTRPQSAQSSRVIPTLLLASVPFERLAAEEHELKLKARWKGQARAYRKLAAERAEKFGLYLRRACQARDDSVSGLFHSSNKVRLH